MTIIWQQRRQNFLRFWISIKRTVHEIFNDSQCKNGNPRFSDGTLETFICSIICKMFSLFLGWMCLIMIIPLRFPVVEMRKSVLLRNHNLNNYIDVYFILNQATLLMIPLWISHCHLCMEGDLKLVYSPFKIWTKFKLTNFSTKLEIIFLNKFL